jgi:hypothetical protein
MSMPWLAHLRVVCCGECGHNPATFDDVTLAQAVLDYHTAGERCGRVKVANFTESQVRERFRVA